MRWGAMPATSGGLDSTSRGPSADGCVLCWELLSHMGEGVSLNLGLSWAVGAGPFLLFVLWSSLFVGHSGILVSAVDTESTPPLLNQYDMPALCYRDSEQWRTLPLVSEELFWLIFHLSLFLSPFSWPFPSQTLIHYPQRCQNLRVLFSSASSLSRWGSMSICGNTAFHSGVHSLHTIFVNISCVPCST